MKTPALLKRRESLVQTIADMTNESEELLAVFRSTKIEAAKRLFIQQRERLGFYKHQLELINTLIAASETIES